MTDKEFTVIIRQLAEASGTIIGIQFHTDINKHVIRALARARLCIEVSLAKLIADRNGET